MGHKPSYEHFKQRVKKLEKEVVARRQAEEALKESEQKYRRIFESIQDVYYEVSIEGIIVELSPSIEEISQYKRENLIGKSLYDIYVDPKQRVEFVKELERKGKVSDYEIFLKDKDGSLSWCSVTAMLITDDQSRPTKVVGSLRNISERKRAEDAVQKAYEQLERRVEERTVELVRVNEELKLQIEERKHVELKYKTLAECSLTGIFIHQDGKYVFANDRFSEIHGYGDEELLGEDYLALIHPDERKAFAKIASARLRGESVPQRYEVRRLRRDGETIWCEMMATRIEYRGRPAIMGNIIDITERKQVEEALLESARRMQIAYDQTINYAEAFKKAVSYTHLRAHET